MEYEIRFYFSQSEYNEFINKLNKIKELNNTGKYYEKTSQFNHSDERYNFYSKEIDGRFRIRKTIGDDFSECKLSWKRRLKDITKDIVNKEEEVELHFSIDEYDNFLFIIENVLHMIEVESYERYRTIYKNQEIEIALDEYPFGLALEIESLKDVNNPKEVIDKYVKLLDLDYKNSYRLSWDDKYEELCKEQNIEKYNHVTFDKKMPKIK